MTKKEIEKFLADTKVYVNGKSKGIQEKLFYLGYKWFQGDTNIDYDEEPFLFIYTDMSFTWGNDIVYFSNHGNREITAEQILSLEVTEPSYRTFKNAEECWQEMLKHEPFGWLKSKESGSYANIACLATSYNQSFIVWSANEKERFPLSYVCEMYKFADGTPFGIKEE